MKKAILTLYIFLFITTFSFSQNFTFNQGGTNQTNYYSVIPYENVGGLIIIEVMINGKKHKFILDTGAANFITHKLMNELNLPVIKNVLVNDQSNKKDSLAVVKMDNVMLGNITFNNIPTLVMDDMITMCFNVDGFIGSNLLRNSIVHFSPIDKTITLTDNKELLSLNKKRASKLFLDKKQSLLFIEVKLSNGKRQVKKIFEFDCGQTDLININFKLLSKLQKQNVPAFYAKGYGSNSAGAFGITKDTFIYKFRIPETIINKTILKNSTFETTLGNDSRMGAKLLNYGTVTLDFINKKFYFEPFTETTNVYEKQLAISPTLKNNKLVVGVVWDENLKDSIHAGDEIISVDGKHFDENNFCDLITSSPFKNKDSITLKIKDSSGKINDFVLTKQ